MTNHEHSIVRKGCAWDTSRWINSCPAVIIWINLFVLIATGAALAGTNSFIFSNQNSNDYLIREEPDVERLQAVAEAKEELGGASDGGEDAKVAERTETFQDFDAIFLTRATAKDLLFDEDRLREVSKLQDRIAKDSGYRKMCLLTDAGLCSLPASIVALPKATVRKYYDNTTAAYPQISVGDSVAEKEAVLSAYAAADEDDASTAALAQLRSLFFDVDFGDKTGKSNSKKGVSGGKVLQSQYLRAIFYGGIPLKGFRNENDNEDRQQEIYGEAMLPLTDYINKERFPINPPPNGVEAIITGGRIAQLEFQTVTITDLYWAGGTIVFILAYIIFHTTSPFIALLGMVHVISTFPYGIVLYKFVFGINFFQTLHSLALFIILGISADTLFLAFDAFQQAPVSKARSVVDAEVMHARLEFSFRRSAKSALATSSTTTAAFLATFSSSIMPISSFGLFAATLVVVNYVMLLVFFPAVLVVWARHVQPLERRYCPCCSCSCTSRTPTPTTKPPPTPSTPPAVDDGEEAGVEMAERGGKEEGQGGEEEGAGVEMSHVKSGHIAAERPVEVFFRDVWTDFVVDYRLWILGFFAVVTALAGWQAARLQPLSSQEEWFPDRHFMGRSSTWMDEEFGTTDRDATVKVDVTWGVVGLDREGTDRYTPTDVGEVEWTKGFDASTPAAQEFLADACDEALDLGVVKELVSCWPKQYRSWREEQGLAFPFEANATAGEEQDSAFVANLRVFAGNESYGGATALTQKRIGLDGQGNLRLVQMQLNTDLLRFEPYDTNLPVYTRLQKFVDALNDKAPKEVGDAMQTAGISWGWMRTERALVVSAIQGMGISVAFAFAVLVLFTTNVYVGGFAALSILGILVWVLGLEGLMGFEFGTSESVSAVLIVGFSVDYVAHIAVHYVTSNGPDRRERVRDALTEMGISIIAGASTTGGGAVWLFGGIVIFFTKFAILIIASLGFSCLFAVSFFPALLATAGPRKDEGSIYHALALCQKTGQDKGEEEKKEAKSKATTDTSAQGQAAGVAAELV